MANLTITVSIGRAVGDTPMPTKRWRQFARVVSKLVATNASDVWVHKAVSRNAYVGQPEDTRTWVFDLDSDKLTMLDDSLDVVRADYGQHSIARTAGTTRLIGIE